MPINKIRTIFGVPCSLILKDKILTINHFKDISQILNIDNIYDIKQIKKTKQIFFHWFKHDMIYYKKNGLLGIGFPCIKIIIFENLVNRKYSIFKNNVDIESLAFSNFNREIVSSSLHSIYLVNLQSKKKFKVKFFNKDIQIQELFFSKNKKVLFISCDFRIYAISFPKLEILNVVRSRKRISNLIALESKKVFVYSRSNNQIVIQPFFSLTNRHLQNSKMF